MRRSAYIINFVIRNIKDMKEYCGSNFILNGELQSVELFDNSLVYKGDSVYEVIRMVKGTPLFFKDHMERLSQSLQLKNKRQLADSSSLKKGIILLARSEKKKEINIKIVFNYNEGKDSYLIYYIDSIYPSKEQCKKGVRGLLFFAERKEPQSKIINYKLKTSVYQELINEGAYEALLVNDENLITEGSKSNIFFMKNSRLITAPDDVILKGITRKHILQICREEGIDVLFECINADYISRYDAVFMTGTSPMVLPFCCINDNYYDVANPLIEKLRSIYMKRAEASIHQFLEVNK